MVKQFRMREILLATVCTVGISGVTQAQFSGSLSLESIYEKGNGGFGANAGLLLPLFSSPCISKQSFHKMVVHAVAAPAHSSHHLFPCLLSSWHAFAAINLL